MSRTVVHDGTVPNDVRNAILSTELPFYDKAGYADLSDFFYVWLRYGLGDLFPEYFRSEVTAKKEELTAFTYRWNGDRQQANAFYAEGMSLAMKNLYESVTEDYPSTVAFQYNDKYYLAPNVALIRINDKEFLPKYMMYYFLTDRFKSEQISKLLQSSSMQNIPMEKIRKFRLPRISLGKR